MFRGRRAQEIEKADWPSLLSLLEDDDQRAAIEQRFPTLVRESFLQALRRLEPKVADSVLATGRQLHTAEQLVNWPTVAVAGMLNSGKTSLVATFLSERGRAAYAARREQRSGHAPFCPVAAKCLETGCRTMGLVDEPDRSRDWTTTRNVG